jgi:hypothetical protein
MTRDGGTAQDATTSTVHCGADDTVWQAAQP